MLFLLLEFDSHIFAVDSMSVETVISPPGLDEITPEKPYGFFEFKGREIPFADLCAVVFGRKAKRLYSTRCAVLRVKGENGADEFVGLVSEGITRTAKVEAGKIATFPSQAGRIEFFREFCTEGGMAKIIDAQAFYERLKTLLPRAK